MDDTDLQEEGPEDVAEEDAADGGLEELAETVSEAIDRPRGPGLLLGIILGAVVGAAVAILLAPSNDEALGEGTLGGLRGRLREATREARQVAQQKESELRARYEELTR